MGQLIEMNVIENIDDDLSAFYVKGDIWNSMPSDTRDTTTLSFSDYRELKTGLPSVAIYDSQTERELASYTPRQGIRLR